MGVLVVDKPVGPTSYEVVRRVQRVLAALAGKSRPRALKAGHGGTLDPLASGVLPVCLGEATKLAPFLLEADKEYLASVRFGIETDTQDAAGAVLAEVPAGHLRESDVRDALTAFRGPLLQVPPMYSALKHEGRPLHSYARAGEEIARTARPVTIFALELLRWESPVAELRVRCSKGTYVRTLATDLGRSLGVGAHLSALRRTVSGPFAIADALPLDEVERLAGAGQWPPLIPLADVLRHLAPLAPGPAVAEALWQGKRVPAADLGLADDATGRYRLLRADGSLLAVVEATAGIVRTVRGFQADGGHGPGSADTAFSPPKPAEEPGSEPENRSSAVAPETKLSATVGLTSTHHL